MTNLKCNKFIWIKTHIKPNKIKTPQPLKRKKEEKKGERLKLDVKSHAHMIKHNLKFYGSIHIDSSIHNIFIKNYVKDQVKMLHGTTTWRSTVRTTVGSRKDVL